MNIFLVLMGILSFLLFFYFVITGIVKRDFKRIVISFLCLGIMLIILLFATKHVINKTASKAKQISENIKAHLKPRLGFEIYVALLANQQIVLSSFYTKKTKSFRDSIVASGLNLRYRQLSSKESLLPEIIQWQGTLQRTARFICFLTARCHHGGHPDF